MSDAFSILLVEDDISLLGELKIFLSDFFDTVEVATTSEAAYALFLERSYDAVLTDIQLPGQSGLKLVEKIQKHSKNQIVIVMSAYKEVDYFLKSIELKVYGFLTKPFDSQKLIAMMLKLSAELKQQATNDLASMSMKLCHGVVFDTKTKLLYVQEQMQELTQKEEHLLTILVKNINYFVPSELLCETIWGDSQICSSTLRALVKRLRDKLSYDGSITNMKGRGYKLNVF